jgi:hypothetical protein
MFKVLKTICVFLILSFFFTNLVSAKTQVVEKITVPENVNSFEMFWPLVAGKTVEDGITYSLKIIKEKVREALIFGKEEKANYKIFIAAKRLLEGEKLLNDTKLSGAEKSFNKTNEELSKAKSLIESALAGSKVNPLTQESSQRLENIIIFSKWLSVQKNANTQLLSGIESLAKSISNLLK